MSYTLEQKREAVKLGDLWWRFPELADEHHQRWTLVHEDLEHYVEDEDLQHKDGIYHIGPTSPTEPPPPRVLSELEGELLEALKELLSAETAEFPSYSEGQRAQDSWAIRKRNAEYHAAAIIQKAEAQQ